MSDIAVHLWTSTVVLAIAMLFARLLPVTARTRHAIRLCGLAKFAIPERVLSGPLRAIGFDIASLGAESSSVIDIRWLGAPQPLRDFAPASASPWPGGIMVFWIISASLLVLAWTLAHHRLVAAALKAVAPASPREREALAAARRSLRLSRSIDIIRSTICEAPVVVRVVRPIVILPDGGCDSLDDDELQSVLRHECAHVARRDNMFSLFGAAIVSVFWFHPLVWIAHRSIITAREEACDEVAATSSSDIPTYVSALSKICEAVLARPLAGVSCMASAHLKERLNHLMRYESLRSHAISHRAAVAIAATVVLSATLASGLRALPASSESPFLLKSWVQPIANTHTLEFSGVVIEAATGMGVLTPTVTFKRGTTATVQSVADPRSFFLEVQDAGSEVHVSMRVVENGVEVQRSSHTIREPEFRPARSNKRYTGDPISLNLKNADIKDVLKTFGQLTGLEVRYPADLVGAVNMNVTDLPWDQVFDRILTEHNLRYELNGTVMVIRRN